MKNTTLLLFALIWASIQLLAHDKQENWVSYHQAIPVKEYVNKNFRVSAKIKAEIAINCASAHLWARTDSDGKTNFFNNMQDKPIISKNWETYTIEGSIGENDDLLIFGALCYFDGAFYYDDIKVEVEMAPNSWETIYLASFDESIEGFKQGVGRGPTGYNTHCHAKIIPMNKTGACLKITSSGVPNDECED